MLKDKMIIHMPFDRNTEGHTSTFTWPSGASFPSEDRDRVQSQAIFGLESVIGILRQAFALGLSRNMAWDISNVEPYLKPSYLKAASVFRRGVHVKDHPYLGRHFTYDIRFFGEVTDAFRGSDHRDLFIVDDQVASYWWNRLPSDYVRLDFSESRKDLETLSAIVTILRNRRSNIRDVVVIGGGVAGDLVGFACGILGLRCHFVPTTLLSMVDSSIGGKVGINFEPWGKNQIGLFYPPASVRIWSGWLATLPELELRSGATEALKHAVLSGNRILWGEIIAMCTNHTWGQSLNLISEAIAVKSMVVSRDPFEMGERATLNFGHTLGHAIEILMSRRGKYLSHGSCVALGMVHALIVSSARFGFKTDHMIQDILKAELLPTNDLLSEVLKLPRNEILELMLNDKKNDSNRDLQFVLLKDWGAPAASSDGRWLVRVSASEARSDLEKTFSFLDRVCRIGS